jgi:dihydroorotase/N-acyl-D-amino-acid deacylase
MASDLGLAALPAYRRALSTLIVLAAGAALWTGCRATPSREPTYDLLITGGRIVDGTGAPWYAGDVAVSGDRIVAIGQLRGASARERIDATGLVVAPGFIDLLGQSEFSLLVDNRAASKITQGVTTEVTGEGTSIAPLNDRLLADLEPQLKHFKLSADWRTVGEYFDRLERARPAINLAMFVGAGGLRAYVVGKDDRAPTSAELERMRQLVAQAMEDGALGLSSSLQYMPDRFASTEELVALAEVAARRGGVYFTHQRSESNRVFESLEEVFAVAERARIPAEIWHLKTAYRANFGKMREVLSRIESARARGLDVTADVYPYTRASNGLDACLPLWVREGGAGAMLARLRDPAQRERIRTEMADPDAVGWENQWYGAGGGEGVMIASVLDPALRQHEGKTLAEIGRQTNKDPRDVVMDIVVADGGNTSVITSIMDEEDVRVALQHPLVSVNTDSGARAEDGPLSGSKSHPRGWGTFPRILGKYVREERLLRLEEAVRKMTSQPASRVRLWDRGILRPGMAADITVFDPNRIADVATFEDPNHYSTGVRFVAVNGRLVVKEGRMTSERPGRALKGPGYPKGGR